MFWSVTWLSWWPCVCERPLSCCRRLQSHCVMETWWLPCCNPQVQQVQHETVSMVVKGQIKSLSARDVHTFTFSWERLSPPVFHRSRDPSQCSVWEPFNESRIKLSTGAAAHKRLLSGTAWWDLDPFVWTSLSGNKQLLCDTVRHRGVWCDHRTPQALLAWREDSTTLIKKTFLLHSVNSSCCSDMRPASRQDCWSEEEARWHLIRWSLRMEGDVSWDPTDQGLRSELFTQGSTLRLQGDFFITNLYVLS